MTRNNSLKFFSVGGGGRGLLFGQSLFSVTTASRTLVYIAQIIEFRAMRRSYKQARKHVTGAK
jgi:hypothetical protein